MSRETILNEINKEREYQVQKWGNDADDTKNSFNDWVSYISRYATTWFPGGFPPYSDEAKVNFRRSMIKTAAIAVAAVESFDRKENS